MNAMAQLASEPTAQPTNLRKDAYDKAWVFDIKIDASAADAYLVLRSTQPIVATPVDGVVYTKGQGLGNAKVFSTSSSTAIRIKEVAAGADYYFAVYAYNITGTDAGTINYLQANPLTGTLRSINNHIDGYYDGIDFNSSNVLVDLKTLINPHTLVAYGDMGPTLVAEFHARDTTNGQKVVNCQYSNEYLLYQGTFSFGANNYSREHRMPFSWVNFTGISRADFEITPEGCDIHALELSNNDVNFQRSNHPFGTALTGEYVYLEFTKGNDYRNKDVADITDARKGDAARAKFYMMLCYNGKYGENWGLDNLLSDADNQELQVLLDWHFADLPDGFEKARHEYVFSKQGNRNPFIDFPNLVNCINFNNMTLTGNCAGFVGIAEATSQVDFAIYPQPTTDLINISFAAPVAQSSTFTVYDLSGKLVSQDVVNLSAGAQTITYQTELLAPGYYIFSIEGNELNGRGKFAVSR